MRIIVNGHDSHEACYKELESRYPYLTVSLIKKTTPGQARNIAIRQGYADYFYFIDDDTELPNFFIKEVCQFIHSHPEVEIFGGPDQSAPAAGIKEKALEFSLRSPLATSKTRWRHLSQEKRSLLVGTEKNLILCNLCVKGAVFYHSGVFFPQGFQRNEENVFLREAELQFNIIYLPYLYIFHKRRPAIANVFYSASQSGFFRYKMLREKFSLDQLIFFLPALFILYLVLLPLILLVDFLRISLLPLLVYLLLNGCYALMIAVKNKDLRYLFLVSFYQLFILVSYGIGVGRSFLKELIHFFKVSDTSHQIP